MGIKDSIKGWFEGDKKKEAFREKVKEAVSDGKLDAKDREIEEVRRSWATDAATHHHHPPRDLQRGGAGGERTATSPRRTSTAGQDQKFLALRNDQVEKTRWDPARLRTTDIRRQPAHGPAEQRVASRRAARARETAHYSLSVELGDLPDPRQRRRVDGSGKPYEQYSVAGHAD